MTWFFVALIAAIATGTANVFDKLLLRKPGLSDPWTYVFWPGIAGFLAIFLVPFGATILPWGALVVALGAGAIFLCGMFFLFAAMRDGEASVALPIIGGLAPIATYLFGNLILGSDLSPDDMAGFVLIVVGCVLLLGVGQDSMRYRNGMLAIVSAGCFGLSNILKKYAFDNGSLLTGLMWISLGGALLALFSLLIARVRERIRATARESEASGRILYFMNRIWALVGGLFVSIAIALGHPALVDAVQSFKYVVIFFGAWLLLREDFSRGALVRKIGAVLLMAAGLIWIGAGAYARSIPVDTNRPVSWGMTFSQKFSSQLGLDWQKNFNAIVSELHPKKMRLIAYWDDIEKERGVFDFSDLDWELARAREEEVRVILTVGMRVPRWPECFMPEWARSLDRESRENALREYLTAIRNRYRNHPALAVWQIENEPFLHYFGQCPARGRHFLEKEIEIFRTENVIADPVPPILITDGGEFGDWYRAVRAGDIFGTTMYRRVYPPSIGRYVGIIDYPLSPSFFILKQKLARWLTGEYEKPFIVIELQAEPWGAAGIPTLSYQEQTNIFSPDYFRETIQYARETGFDEYYLWGAEWWYWVRETQGDDRYWEEAKKLFGR